MKLKRLQESGLSLNESKTYLSLIKLGNASANEISRDSGVHRVSIYDALRGLREKGLVSQITKENKFLFEAANPEKIKEIVEEKEDSLKRIKEIVPELLEEFNANSKKQEVHSFKNLIGVKTILGEMLKSKTEILDFGAEHKIKEFFPYFYPHWDKERIKKKIKMKIVANKKIKSVKMTSSPH